MKDSAYRNYNKSEDTVMAQLPEKTCIFQWFTSLTAPDWSSVSGSGEDAVIDLSNIFQTVLMRRMVDWDCDCMKKEKL